jgi:hypothetical protein
MGPSSICDKASQDDLLGFALQAAMEQALAADAEGEDAEPVSVRAHVTACHTLGGPPLLRLCIKPNNEEVSWRTFCRVMT